VKNLHLKGRGQGARAYSAWQQQKTAQHANVLSAVELLYLVDRMLLVGFTLGLTLYLVSGVFWFRRRRHDYTHLRHTISELGEVGAPDARAVSSGLFAPIGVGLLMLGWMVNTGSAPSEMHAAVSLLAVVLGIGYLGGAIFPCDPGSPLGGSWRQQLHNLAGGVEYVGGALALLRAAQAMPEDTLLHNWLQISAGGVAIVAVGLSIQALFPVRGVVQRVGEFLLFGNLVLLIWLIQ
jgi:hypothetical protein